MARVTITLSEGEAKFLRSFCLLRPMKAASDILAGLEEDTGDYSAIADDLWGAGPIIEEVRFKLVNALNQAELASKA